MFSKSGVVGSARDDSPKYSLALRMTVLDVGAHRRRVHSAHRGFEPTRLPSIPFWKRGLRPKAQARPGILCASRFVPTSRAAALSRTRRASSTGDRGGGRPPLRRHFSFGGAVAAAGGPRFRRRRAGLSQARRAPPPNRSCRNTVRTKREVRGAPSESTAPTARPAATSRAGGSGPVGRPAGDGLLLPGSPRRVPPAQEPTLSRRLGAPSPCRSRGPSRVGVPRPPHRAGVPRRRRPESAQAGHAPTPCQGSPVPEPAGSAWRRPALVDAPSPRRLAGGPPRRGPAPPVQIQARPPR